MTMFYEVTVTFTDGSYSLAYAGTSQRTAEREYSELCDRTDTKRIIFASEDTTYGRHKNYGTHECVYCDHRSPIVMMRASDYTVTFYRGMVCIDHDACMRRIHNRYHDKSWPTDDCAYC